MRAFHIGVHQWPKEEKVTSCCCETGSALLVSWDSFVANKVKAKFPMLGAAEATVSRHLGSAVSGAHDCGVVHPFTAECTA